MTSSNSLQCLTVNHKNGKLLNKTLKLDLRFAMVVHTNRRSFIFSKRAKIFALISQKRLETRKFHKKGGSL